MLSGEPTAATDGHEDCHIPKGRLQSGKLTFLKLKMDGWNTIVSFLDGLFSGAFASPYIITAIAIAKKISQKLSST